MSGLAIPFLIPRSIRKLAAPDRGASQGVTEGLFAGIRDDRCLNGNYTKESATQVPGMLGRNVAIVTENLPQHFGHESRSTVSIWLESKYFLREFMEIDADISGSRYRIGINVHVDSDSIRMHINGTEQPRLSQTGGATCNPVRVIVRIRNFLLNLENPLIHEGCWCVDQIQKSSDPMNSRRHIGTIVKSRTEPAAHALRTADCQLFCGSDSGTVPRAQTPTGGGIIRAPRPLAVRQRSACANS